MMIYANPLRAADLQQSLDIAADKTKENICKTADAARNESLRYTQAISDFHDKTLQTSGEVVENYLESQKETIDTLSSCCSAYFPAAYTMNYFIPQRIANGYSKMFSTFTNNFISTNRLSNNIASAGVELLKVTLQNAKNDSKELSRIGINAAKTFEELSKDTARNWLRNDIIFVGEELQNAKNDSKELSRIGINAAKTFEELSKDTATKELSSPATRHLISTPDNPIEPSTFDMDSETKKTEKEVFNGVIERYPSARFPEKIALGDTVPLEIIIKAVKPGHDVSITSTSITLKVNSLETQVPVQVFVDTNPSFEIIGKYYATIFVPTKAEDSKPVAFFIKSIQEGLQTIIVRFFHQESYVGDLKINTQVVSTKTGSDTYSQIKPTLPEWTFSKVLSGPDMTLFIYEKSVSPQFEYDVLFSTKDIPLDGVGGIKFPFNPEEKFRSIFKDIENTKLPANVMDDNIKNQGKALYEELFPERLKKLYWEMRDKIKSVRVISKEPWIPWEIVKPYRDLSDGDIEEDPFLCEHYAFSRWIMGESEKVKEEEFKKIKVIVPSDTNLSKAIEERDWILQFANNRGLEISVDSTYEQVISTLENGGFDLLHFSTHGQYDSQDPLFSSVQLEKKIPLRVNAISGVNRKFGKDNPLVILNACQTSTQGFSLTGIQSWATKFLNAGARVFIGTLWSVTDDFAFKFAQELYYQIFIGTALGEAVQKARNYCKRAGDPSWLAYQLYGHPNLQVKVVPK